MEKEKDKEKENSKGKPDEENMERVMEWRCLTCGKSAPPTNEAFMGFLRHKCKGDKDIKLIDANSGEVLAGSRQEAQAKGLITQKKEGEITTPQVSKEGIFEYKISLPAEAWALFHVAKTAGLEKDGNKSFDEWVWERIIGSFKYEYKMQLVLARREEE